MLHGPTPAARHGNGARTSSTLTTASHVSAHRSISPKLFFFSREKREKKEEIPLPLPPFPPVPPTPSSKPYPRLAAAGGGRLSTGKKATVPILARSLPPGAVAPPPTDRSVVGSVAAAGSGSAGAMSKARVYADVNVLRPKEYWDYEALTVQWGSVLSSPLLPSLARVRPLAQASVSPPWYERVRAANCLVGS